MLFQTDCNFILVALIEICVRKLCIKSFLFCRKLFELLLNFFKLFFNGSGQSRDSLPFLRVVSALFFTADYSFLFRFAGVLLLLFVTQNKFRIVIQVAMELR